VGVLVRKPLPHPLDERADGQPQAFVLAEQVARHLDDAKGPEELVQHPFADVDVPRHEVEPEIRQDHRLLGGFDQVEKLRGLDQIKGPPELLARELREFEDIRPFAWSLVLTKKV
jgi:hypothetical protein